MDPNAVFLTRLRQVVDGAGDEQIARATALLIAHRNELYVALGIGTADRPTPEAKAHADEALDDLRLRILNAEVRASASAAHVFTTIRRRIEMERRALATRMVAARTPVATAAPSVVVLHMADVADRAARHDDRHLLHALRCRARDRRQVIASYEAIWQSLALLEHCDGPSVA